jgi:hypothetical protein
MKKKKFGDTVLYIQIDGMKKPLFLSDTQIERLKDYLNKNF